MSMLEQNVTPKYEGRCPAILSEMLEVADNRASPKISSSSLQARGSASALNQEVSTPTSAKGKKMIARFIEVIRNAQSSGMGDHDSLGPHCGFRAN